MKKYLEIGTYVIAAFTVVFVLTAILASVMPTAKEIEPVVKVLFGL